jgi:hypothetical protein
MAVMDNLVSQLLQAIQQIQTNLQPGINRVKQAWQEDPQQFNYLAQHPLLEPLTRNSPTRRPFTEEDILALHGGVSFEPSVGSLQMVLQRARGQGFLADFDEAINSGDWLKANSIMRELPDVSPYKQSFIQVLNTIGKLIP